MNFARRSGATCCGKKSKPAGGTPTAGNCSHGSSLREFSWKRATRTQAGKMSSTEIKELVRWKGLEPSRYCYRQPLKLVRLPIPPPPQNQIVVSIRCSDRGGRLRTSATINLTEPSILIVLQFPAKSIKLWRISILLTTTVSGSEPSEAAWQAPDSEPEFFQESPQARAL